MNKRYIILFGVILLLAYIGYFLHIQFPKVISQNTTNTITYYCQEGILSADYGTSYVTLTFPDGKNILLPQVVSGSGIRYELGENSFSSKGAHAFLMEGTSTVYTNCVSGNQTTTENVNTYTDAAKTFSFTYPTQFTLSGGDSGYSQEWSIQGSSLGLVFAKVIVPKSFYTEKTNFSEAKFTIGTSADETAIKNCLISDQSNEGDVMKVMIGDREFTRITYGDAGAGNYYETQSYRTLYNNQCYAIEYTIHSTNIYNYSPDQGVKQFDKTKITSVLENMVQSFKFL